MKVSKTFLVLFLLVIGLSSSAGPKKKQLLVVESPPPGAEVYNDFPRLLLLQIAKSGTFRCIDRATYRTQKPELKLGDGGAAEFSSAGYCISWVIRSRETSGGTILTVSLGYNDITQGGNNELLQSEEVVVYDRNLKGESLISAAARKSARAILFRLMPPQVVEVSKLKSGLTKVTTDYGRDFFSVGDKVKFVKKKALKTGKEVSVQTGTGVVRAVETDSSALQLLTGKVDEEGEIEFVDAETESAKSGQCPVCGGRKKVRLTVKCMGCNGQGKLWHIRGRNRNLKPCQECNGRGTRTMDKVCDECSGAN